MYFNCGHWTGDGEETLPIGGMCQDLGKIVADLKAVHLGQQ